MVSFPLSSFSFLIPPLPCSPCFSSSYFRSKIYGDWYLFFFWFAFLNSCSVCPCPSPPHLIQGFYRGGKFVFSFKVGQASPHEPPKVKCETQVYHPNIDLEGNICLNILREDWKPVLTINSIIYGLQYLFLEPNPEDPLNKEAAEVLQSNRRVFEQNVQKSMRGGYVGNNYFERCLKWVGKCAPEGSWIPAYDDWLTWRIRSLKMSHRRGDVALFFRLGCYLLYCDCIMSYIFVR